MMVGYLPTLYGHKSDYDTLSTPAVTKLAQTHELLNRTTDPVCYLFSYDMMDYGISARADRIDYDCSRPSLINVTGRNPHIQHARYLIPLLNGKRWYAYSDTYAPYSGTTDNRPTIIYGAGTFSFDFFDNETDMYDVVHVNYAENGINVEEASWDSQTSTLALVVSVTEAGKLLRFRIPAGSYPDGWQIKENGQVIQTGTLSGTLDYAVSGAGRRSITLSPLQEAPPAAPPPSSPPAGGTDEGGSPPPTSLERTIKLEVSEDLLTSERLKKFLAGLLEYSPTESELRQTLSNTASLIDTIETSIHFESGREGSEFLIKMKNNNNRDILNFIVYQSIPKSFAESADMLTIAARGSSYSVIEPDPELLFLFPDFRAGQEIFIKYTTPIKAPISSAEEILTEAYAFYSSVCNEGAQRCMAVNQTESSPPGMARGNNIQTCRNGVWITTKYCEDQCAENPARCITLQPCTEGEYACEGNDLFLCSDGKWEIKETCEYKCSEGECVKQPGIDASVLLFIAAVSAVAASLIIFSFRRRQKTKRKHLRRQKKNKRTP
jgi:hypothetical protein